MFALLGYLALAGAPPGPETVFNDAGYIQIKNANGTGSLFYCDFNNPPSFLCNITNNVGFVRTHSHPLPSPPYSGMFESRNNPATDPFVFW